MSARGVRLEGVSKLYGEFAAVRSVDLEIPGGSYYCLLGPSGSGKSTVLRLVAGLETLSAGRVFIGDVDMSTVSPNRRPVHTVFQAYALFPRMSVFDNVAYGLRAQRAGSRAEIATRVRAAVEQVRLGGSEHRRPAELSGGMQQRVALARALVNRPDVLLLDEPLGALDLKLRREMQDELVRLQRESGTTFVHVTHDQEECFACAAQVAVMREGVVEQVGAPRAVYRQPRTGFVATFLGSANVIPVTVVSGSGTDYVVRWPGGDLMALGPAGLTQGAQATLVIRPEDIEVMRGDPTSDAWRGGRLLDVQHAASTLRLRISVLGSELVAERTASPSASIEAEAGETVSVRLDREQGWLVAEPSGASGGPSPSAEVALAPERPA